MTSITCRRVVVIVALLTLGSSGAAAIECPQPSEQYTRNVTGDAELELRGMLSRFVSGGFEGNVEIIADNLFSQYPNPDMLIVVRDIISIGCQVIDESSGWSDDQKIQHLNTLTDQAVRLMQRPTPPSTGSNPIDVIGRAMAKLEAMKGGRPDVGVRNSGISDLRLLAAQQAPTKVYEVAVDALVSYVRTNLPDRKLEDRELRIEEDRGMYIAEDINNALKALQALHLASNSEVEVKLAGLDFNYMSLAYVNLRGFDLSFSTFRNGALGPNLQDINFSFADFYNTAIWNADLSGSNFHKAQMRGIKLMNPKLDRTNIDEAYGLGEMAIFCNPTGLSAYQKSKLPSGDC